MFSSSEEITNLERTYLVQNYARYPLVLREGKGCYVYDVDGKKYLDLISGIGVNALGYAHPRITKVIREQAGRLVHTSNLYYNEYQARLAERLAGITGLARSFFCNSGAEAIETALKIARAHGNARSSEKHEVVALEGSFHGRTLGAISVTGEEKYRRDFQPLLPGARFIRRSDVQALEGAVTGNTACIILELIQGESGIRPVSEPFARRARELADRNDALLVFDEIQCGLGRTGVRFAYQRFDPIVQPDVVVTAKPIACGIPLGATIASERAAASLKLTTHGSTYGGGPLACRVALEFLELMDELLPSIRTAGVYFRTRLEDLKKRFGFIKEVRGEGLMLAMELEISCKPLVLDGIAEGALFNCTHETTLRFLPPYIIGKREIDQAIKKLTKIFKKVKPAA